MRRKPAGTLGVLEGDRERLECGRLDGIDQTIRCIELAERPLDLDLPDSRCRNQDVIRWAGDRGRRSVSSSMSDSYDLERFVTAQQGVYNGVLDELRSGRKVGHWIWFIFPQITGLGYSAMSQRYAISSLDEARAYLAHPVLGARLRECAASVLATTGRTALEILGSIDAVKLRSSMTLFHRAAPEEAVFARVIERFYDGRPDDATDARLT